MLLLAVVMLLLLLLPPPSAPEGVEHDGFAPAAPTAAAAISLVGDSQVHGEAELVLVLVGLLLL